MDVVEEAILDKKFGKDFMDQYTRSLITRSLKEETGSVKLPQSGKEFDEMFDADPKFREMVERSFDEEDENPIVPEISTMEEKLRVAKTINQLLEIAKTEGIILTPEKMREIREHALDIWVMENKNPTS